MRCTGLCLGPLLWAVLAPAACSMGALGPEGAGEPQWVHLETDEKAMVGIYEVYLKHEVGATAGLYLKRTPKEPYWFITKEIRSSADILMSRSGQYLLINAPCSPIARCVFIADAEQFQPRGWIISRQARAAYTKRSRETGDSPRASERVDPVGVAFSPDESKVLLRMIPADPSTGTEDAPWVFVVDVEGGEVLSEYRTEDLPSRWWDIQEDEGGFISGG